MSLSVPPADAGRYTKQRMVLIEQAQASPGGRAPMPAPFGCRVSEVSFLDSAGLNVLVRSQRRLANQGAALRIVVPADLRLVRKAFEITRLTESLEVVQSLDQALTQSLCRLAGDRSAAVSGGRRGVGTRSPA